MSDPVYKGTNKSRSDELHAFHTYFSLSLVVRRSFREVSHASIMRHQHAIDHLDATSARISFLHHTACSP